MLRTRISPVILIDGPGLNKTKKFKNYKYLGDAINVLKIFNELSVDELVIYDITRDRNDINFDLLKKINREANMAITYGGKISSVSQVEELINIGCEKVSICSSILDRELIIQSASKVGAQSIALTLDYKENLFGSVSYYGNFGKNKLAYSTDEMLSYISGLPVGEIILQNINYDGLKMGYSTSLIDEYSKLGIPLKIVGGCKDANSIIDVHSKFSLVSYGVGSYFCLKGKLDAVLISYERPDV
jgi:imidazole glycerol-phosphate synthase subunit HisF